MHTHETQSRRESCVLSFNHLILYTALHKTCIEHSLAVFATISHDYSFQFINVNSRRHGRSCFADALVDLHVESDGIRDGGSQVDEVMDNI